MKQVAIKNQEHTLSVSGIVLGTTYLGNMDNREAYEQLTGYYELGGRCIDTARAYSNLSPTDIEPSEAVIGRWLRETGLRSDITLSTKGGHPPYGKMHVSRLGYHDIREDLEKSLEALQTDCIDLYWLHRDDEQIPADEMVDILDEFADKGLIRCYGASNWSADRIRTANEYAARRNRRGFSASQIQWSLAVCTPADWNDDTLVCMDGKTLKDYEEMQLPVFAYNAQAKGLLSKLSQGGESALDRKTAKRYLGENNRETNLKRAERVMTLAKQHHVSEAVIALTYLTSHRLACSAVIGCSKRSQLRDSMRAGDFALSMDEVQWLEEA